MREASRAWSRRVALGAVAIGGSALYAWSFRGEPLAWRVALAAGLSWLALGAALLAVTKARPSVLAWADACLATMAVGMGVLLLAVLLNLSGRGTLLPHLVILLASNVAMAVAFTRQARRLGMPARLAAALFLCALDGAFLVLLVVLP